MGLQIPDTDIELNENPFTMAGYGVNSFIDVLKHVSLAMLCLSILAIPIFLIYSGMGNYY